MAQATPDQIRLLEQKHKEALVNLIQAGKFRLYLFNKYGKTGEPFVRYNKYYVPLTTKWADREKKLEDAGAPKLGITYLTFATNQGIAQLEVIARKLDKNQKGIGFIPILIWAVVAIAGFFTADQIVDELNTTSEEQQSLITTTQDFCKQYNLDAEECKKMITEQTEVVKDKEDGIVASIVKPLLLVGGAYLLITNSDKIFKSKKS